MPKSFCLNTCFNADRHWIKYHCKKTIQRENAGWWIQVMWLQSFWEKPVKDTIESESHWKWVNGEKCTAAQYKQEEATVSKRQRRSTTRLTLVHLAIQQSWSVWLGLLGWAIGMHRHSVSLYGQELLFIFRFLPIQVSELLCNGIPFKCSTTAHFDRCFDRVN